MTRYYFPQTGGFYAIDDTKQIAAYAYPTSPHADAARDNPAKIGRAMLADFPDYCSQEIKDSQYQRAIAVAGPAL